MHSSLAIRRLLRSAAMASLVACTTPSLAGCFLWTTRTEGDELQKKTARHDRQLRELEQSLQKKERQLEGKIAELEDVLERATRVVTRNSADVGAQVEALREKLASVKGELAEVQHKLETLTKEMESQRKELEDRMERVARKAGMDMAVDPEEIPETKDEHFQLAQDDFAAEKHSRARALYREFLSRYPNDRRAAEAKLKIGLGYLEQDQPASALGELRNVIAEHGKSDQVDPALFGMAQAFWKLNACTDAKDALRALMKRRPSRELQNKARSLMREIQRAPAERCTS